MNFSQGTCEAKTYLHNDPTSITQNLGQYVISFPTQLVLQSDDAHLLKSE